MSRTLPRAGISSATSDEAERIRALVAFCDRVAWLLDDCLRIPGTRFRFGLDAIVGLVPLAGDALGLIVSAATMARAARSGVPKSLLMKMGRNIVIDFFGSLVPVFGDAFDAVFKAHRRNFDLLRKEYAPMLPAYRTRSGAPWPLRVLAAVLLALLSWWLWRLLVN